MNNWVRDVLKYEAAIVAAGFAAGVAAAAIREAIDGYRNRRC